MVKSSKTNINKNDVGNEKLTINSLYNCAGSALNIFTWYLPYKGHTKDENEDILNLVENNYSAEQIYEIKLHEYTAYLLRDFPNLKLVSNPVGVKTNERLIAFRFYYKEEYCGDDESFEIFIDSDFHFRYYEDNHWYESNCLDGTYICDDDMEGDWHLGTNCYNSRTVYFVLGT